jgi:hypothetical protein
MKKSLRLNTTRLSKVLICLLAPTLVSCTIYVPKGREVTAGHKYSKESVAFLDLPDATRKEAVENLGEPLWESSESRVLLYVWESWFKWQVDEPHWLREPPEEGEDAEHAKEEEEDSTHYQRWGLFVAYDEMGLVYRHEIRRFGKQTLEEECGKWARQGELSLEVMDNSSKGSGHDALSRPFKIILTGGTNSFRLAADKTHAREQFFVGYDSPAGRAILDLLAVEQPWQWDGLKGIPPGKRLNFKGRTLTHRWTYTTADPDPKLEALVSRLRTKLEEL